MDFATAKLQVNPDPKWWPSRGSAEYQEILTLMKYSGTVQLTDTIPLAPQANKGHMWDHGRYINPINATIKTSSTSKISKKDFMALPSNKQKMDEHIHLNGKPVMIVEKPAKGSITAQPTRIPEGKIMSKQDFLNLGENRQFVEQHINYYK